MNLDDFDFELPPELIAQQPARKRDASRLLVLDRDTGSVRHRSFADLGELLRPTDLLVLNDTRVRPARLVGRKPTGGRVELLLVERLDEGRDGAIWRCLVKASRQLHPGSRIELGEGLSATALEADAEGHRRVRFEARGDLEARLERQGLPPLPPYIRRDDGDPEVDRERYQTVYARRPGAIAAPTAGLHFTGELLERLARRGIDQAYLTLHVGLGTFTPINVRRVEEHRLLPEWLEIGGDVVRSVEAARRRGGRVVAVGTTVVRALESSATDDGKIRQHRGSCELFIYPGFRFRVVDALITNFHLPRSTLLMLASAFAGRERLLATYRQAMDMGYRFYSYGDAMLLESSR